MSKQKQYGAIARADVLLVPKFDHLGANIAKQTQGTDVVKAGEQIGLKLGETIGKAVGVSTKKNGGTLAKAFSSAADSASKAVQGKLGAMSSKVGATFADLGSRFRQNNPHIMSMGKAISSMATGAIAGLGSIKGAVSGAAGYLSSKFPQASDMASQALKKLKDVGSTALSGIGNAAHSAFAAIGKTAKAGLVAVTVALGVAAKSAFDSFASFEQLEGGVQTLFGTQGARSVEEYAELVGKSVDEVRDQYAKLDNAQSTVMKNAQGAYKTAGMSANEYMENVTSFAASLVSSLGGDTEKAAVYADRAMVDMSDNANKMGSSMESITNAYQGFAKQNYTMLDNLKLGYGGTQEEMKRLIKDASQMTDTQKKLGISVDSSSMSFDNIVNAIHVVQESMGIAGTTSREAASTIEGSVNMAKSAWSNWLTELGKDDADMETRTTELVEALGTAAENIVPRLGQIADAAISALPGLVSQVAGSLKDQLMKALPESLRESAQGTFDKLEELGNRAGEAFGGLVERLAPVAPVVMDIGGKIGDYLVGCIDGAVAAFEWLSPIIGSLAENFLPLLSGAIDVISQAWGVLCDAIQPVADWLGPVLADTVIPAAADAFGLIGDAISTVLDCASALIDGIKGVVEFLGGAFDALSDQVTGAADSCAKTVDEMGVTLPNGTGSAARKATKEFDRNLSGMGKSAKSSGEKAGQSLAKSLNSAAPGVQRASTKLASSAQKPQETMAGQLGKYGTQGGTALASGLKNTTPAVSSAARGLSSAQGAARNGNGAAYGSAFGNGIVGGLNSTAGGVGSAAANLRGQQGGAKNDSGYSYGNAFGGSLASGIGSKRSSVRDEAARIGSAQTAANMSGSSYAWGNDLVNNLKAGMAAARTILESEVKRVAGVIWSNLHQSTAEVGKLKDTDTWGVDLVMNIVDGMKDREDELRKESVRLAGIINGELSPAYGKYGALPDVGDKNGVGIGDLIAAIDSFHRDLGPIIGEYAPAMTYREHARFVRGAMNRA